MERMVNEERVWIKDVPAMISEDIEPVSLWTIRSWCRKGLIKSVKVGGKRYVDLESLKNFLKGEAAC
tara:strand:- start:528 stop:728 length:201 start_codon:yes stop_codon:yes gene_type:complete